MEITLDEIKGYLRVDSTDEDPLLETFLNAATQIAIDVARLTKEQWEDIRSDKIFSVRFDRNEIDSVRSLMRMAILYATAYLYEHREEADHRDLKLTLRAMLSSIREGVNL